jgi:hypothetical protein
MSSSEHRTIFSAAGKPAAVPPGVRRRAGCFFSTPGLFRAFAGKIFMGFVP